MCRKVAVLVERTELSHTCVRAVLLWLGWHVPVVVPLSKHHIVVFVKPIQLYDVNQAVSVDGVGGIARTLQSVCPASIVRL